MMCSIPCLLRSMAALPLTSRTPKLLEKLLDGYILLLSRAPSLVPGEPFDLVLSLLELLLQVGSC